MRMRGWFFKILLFLAVILLAGREITSLIVDHSWYTAMGVRTLFWERVIDTFVLRGGAWLAGSLFAFANLYAVRRTIATVAMQSRVANLELTAMVSSSRLLSITIIISLAIGALLSAPMNNWTDLALVRHGLPFQEIEGILNRDLSYYLYWLPLEEALYLWALVSLVSLTAMVLVLYALTRSLRLEGRRLTTSTHVRRHLSVLGGLVLLLLAWSYRLDAFDLLQYGSGPDGLFVRLDHRVILRIDALLSAMCTLAALVVLHTGWMGQIRAALITLTIVLASAIGLRHITPPIIVRSGILGEAAGRDQDYVVSRALFSRRAFDVDGMRMATAATSEASGSPAQSLDSAPPLVANGSIARSVSLWNEHSLIGGLGPGVSAARSMDRRGTDERGGPPLPEPARIPGPGRVIDATPLSWTVTDGHISALVVRRPIASGENWRLSLVDATQAVLRDSVLDPLGLRPIDSDAAWPLVGPGLAGEMLVDGARNPDIFGASLATVGARIAHAWALRDITLLQEDRTRSERPMLVTHRDVRERVRLLAPIFAQGDQVLPLRDGGRLYWTLHLYSASDHYPLSQRWLAAGNIYSYFRLAATALVDAATGRVRLIPAEKPDPVARTWMSRLPSLFTASDELPPSLTAQLPPATDGATVQIRTFVRYGSRRDGMTARHLPDSVLAGAAPSPVAFLDPRGSVTGWTVPVLGAGDVLDGVATVLGGSSRTTWWTRTALPVHRWRALLSQLSEALDSAGAAGMGGGATDSRRHYVQPVPLLTTRGLIVVQPILRTRGDASLAVTAVGVTDGRMVGVDAAMVRALAAIGIVSTEAPDIPGLPSSTNRLLQGDLVRFYDAMLQAMRRGDWNAFGAAFDSLGHALGRRPK